MNILYFLSVRYLSPNRFAVHRNSIFLRACLSCTCESFPHCRFHLSKYHLGQEVKNELILSRGSVQRKRRLFTAITLLNVKEMELQQFDKVFPEIIQNVTEDYINSDVRKAILWLKEVVEYNVPFGKKTRGIFVVKGYKYISGNENLSDEDSHLANVLGWCVEMLQAYFLVADDIMDQSQLRRGKPCWYKRNGVGLIAINDAFSLETSLYMLLKRHFRHKNYYIDIVDLFHEVTFQTVLGQSLDLMTSGQLDLNKFTVETYSAIVKYKTAFYSFYLPIALAMYMSGIGDEERHSKAKEVLLELGHLFQVQDDYIDCFGDPAKTGKVGTDIEEGKCCWLVVMALQKANETQRNVIQENYRQKDPKCQAKIKSLYEELGIPELYRKYEDECYEKIIGLIKNLEGLLPTNLFYELTNAIYRRER